MNRPTMRLLVLLGLAPVASCGDDSPVGGGGTVLAGGTSAAGGSNAGASDAGGAPAGGSNSDGGGNLGGMGGGASGACVPADVLAELNEFVTTFGQAAALLAGHPGPSEATGFYLAPGLPEPPAVVATFAGPLIMVCSDPLLYDPYCEQGHCSRIECTGDGAAWDFHFYLDGPFQSDDFSFSQLDIDHHWADGAAGTTFDFALAATGPADRVWDATGTGALDLESGALELTFPDLLGHAAL
ncbi:MAG: hypothetical protein JNK04_02175, partial [Myxococcales bacterium]|nr:hypothetical protein [Myxococcales bacterium]